MTDSIPSNAVLSRLRLAEAEHCRQRSLGSSLLGEAADEIERLQQKLLAAERLAVRQGNEIRKLERNRDALEADLQRFVAHAARGVPPPLPLPSGHDVWVRCGNVKTQDVHAVMQAIRDLMPPRPAQPPCGGITGWKNAKCTKVVGHDGPCEFSPGSIRTADSSA